MLENTIVVPPEKFAQMECSEIEKLMRENKHYSITGISLGVDRCIIRPNYEYYYENPYHCCMCYFSTLEHAQKQAKADIREIVTKMSCLIEVKKYDDVTACIVYGHKSKNSCKILLYSSTPKIRLSKSVIININPYQKEVKK